MQRESGKQNVLCSWLDHIIWVIIDSRFPEEQPGTVYSDMVGQQSLSIRPAGQTRSGMPG